jgi:hypothetical protein
VSRRLSPFYKHGVGLAGGKLALCPGSPAPAAGTAWRTVLQSRRADPKLRVRGIVRESATPGRFTVYSDFRHHKLKLNC